MIDELGYLALSFKMAARTPALMNPYKLVEEEMEHELEIRGLDYVMMTIQEKADLLKENLTLPQLTERIERCEPEYEYQVLRAKVGELEALFAENFENLEASNRYPTLFIHTLFRVRRTMFRSQDRYEDFIRLARNLVKLHKRTALLLPYVQYPSLHIPGDEKELDEKLKRLKLDGEEKGKKQKKGPKVELSASESDSDSSASNSSSRTSRASRRKGDRKKNARTKKGKKKKKGRRRDSSTSDSSPTSEESSPERRSRQRYNRVTSWKIRYEKGPKIHAFLRDIEDFVEMHNVRDDELLRGISGLLEGAAKNWYRSNKVKITTWKQFKTQIKLAFAPDDDDDEISEQINKLRQGEDETFAVFEARAEELFDRMTEPLTEREKLKKLLKAIHLYYREKIRSDEVDTVRELRKKCAKLEKDKHQILRLKKEQDRGREKTDRMRDDRRGDRRERGVTKAYAVEEATNCRKSEESSNEGSEVDAAAVMPRQPKKRSEVVCHRCGGAGHYMKECTEAIKCIQCGTPNTAFWRCHVCAMMRAARSGNIKEGQSAAGGPVPWTTIPPPPIAKHLSSNSPNPQRNDSRRD